MEKQQRKKNLLKIPPNIHERIASFQGDAFVAGCILKLKTADIQAGEYKHIGITWSNAEGQPTFSSEIVPNTRNGRYSKYNVVGREIVHDEELKTRKSYTILSPNYGDWSKGSHLVSLDREVYRREWQHPQFLSILIEHVGEDLGGQTQTFRFRVPEVMDRTTDYQEQLLFNLNLLQENVGNPNVFESDATLYDYLGTLYVNWEILPPGEEEEAVTKIITTNTAATRQIRAEIRSRYEFLRGLKPRNWIVGTSGFMGYFGAQFADDLVVMENVQYGNAIYVMFEEWQRLSQKTRTELLSSPDEQDHFLRVRHTPRWRGQLKAVLKLELKKRMQR